MSATVWSQFYWSDWVSDDELMSCSLAAQGLWMRMLCIAARDPMGRILIGEAGATAEDLARLTGTALDEVKNLLDELRRKAVFSVTRGDVMYCRRMAKAGKRRKASSKGGKKGGPITFEQKKGIHATPGGTPPPMEITKSHKPITKERDKDSDSKKATEPDLPFDPNPQPPPEIGQASRPKAVDDAFEEFWKIYPRRVAKGGARGARAAFMGALKKTTVEVVLAGARRYAAASAGKDPEFIAYPSTWLNQERWADEAAGSAPAAIPAYLMPPKGRFL